MAIIPHKHCTKCGTLKPLTDFHQDRRKPDGYTPACKDCRNAHRKVIYEASDYDRNRRKVAYWANPERDRSAVKAYRAAHLESVRAKGRAWYHANRERAKQTHKLWARQHRAQRRNALRSYVARRRGNGGKFSPNEWEALKRRYDFTCLCCGRKEPEITLAADHIVPVSKGGHSYIDNIQPLCGPCNSAKRDKIIDYRPDKGRRIYRQQRMF